MSENSSLNESSEHACLFCGKQLTRERVNDRRVFEYNCPHCRLHYLAGGLALANIESLSDEDRAKRGAYVGAENDKGKVPRLA